MSGYRPFGGGGSGGGGGGSGNVAWGPDFGGEDGDKLQAETAIDLTEVGLEGNLVAGAALMIGDDGVFLEADIGIQAGIAIDSLAIQGGIASQVSLTMPQLDMEASLATETTVTFAEMEAEYINAHLMPQPAISIITADLDYALFADAVDSNTNWTNTTNALGDTTSTFAALTATSSGVGGITSNDTTGTLVLGFDDVSDVSTLGTLTIENTPVIYVERAIVSSGTLPLNQAVDVQWEFSTNGTDWTTIQDDQDVVAKGIVNAQLGVASTTRPTFHDAVVRSGGGTAVDSFSLPAGTAAGDLAVYVCSINSGTDTTDSSIADWDKVVYDTTDTGSGSLCYGIAYKTLDSGDLSGTYNFFTALGGRSSHIAVFKATDGEAVVSSVSTNATTVEFADFSTADNSLTALFAVAAFVTGIDDGSYPDTYTEEVEYVESTRLTWLAIKNTDSGTESLSAIAPTATLTGTVRSAGWALNITTTTASDYVPPTLTELDDLQVRGTGTVTSGTGLSAQIQAQFYRAWCEFETKVTF